MDELSDRAHFALEQLTRGMTPDPLKGAVAWAHIEERIEREREAAEARNWRRRGWRTYGFARSWVRRLWQPILVMTIIVFALAPFLRRDMSGSAHLELARSYNAQGDHVRAYNTLVAHSRHYKSRSAAEERMGIALDALCALDLHERAEDDLRRYLELAPDSIHAERLPQPCR